MNIWLHTDWTQLYYLSKIRQNAAFVAGMNAEWRWLFSRIIIYLSIALCIKEFVQRLKLCDI